MKPYFILRTVGGLMYLAGAIIMAFNVVMTILGHEREESPIPGAEAALVPAQ